MNEFDMKSALQAIGASLLLAVAGFLIHPYFQELSFFQMKGVRIQALEMGTQSKIRIIFTVAFAFIPLLFFGMRKMLKLTDNKQKIFAVCAILIAGIIFWQYKINSLNTLYNDLGDMYFFALEDLNLELYLLIGLIMGAILGGVALYRFKKRP